MKKIIAILTALSLILALCVTFTACGEKTDGSSDSEEKKEDPFVGEWESTEVESDYRVEDTEYKVTMTVTDDGSFTFVLTQDGGSFIMESILTGTCVEEGEVLNCTTKHIVDKTTVNGMENEPKEEDTDSGFTASLKEDKLFVEFPSGLKTTLIKK